MSDETTREDRELQESLQRHYLTTADDKVAKIDGALASLRSAPDRVDGPYLIIHTLAGNAGTYGFPDISEAALAISRRLQAERYASPELLEQTARFREQLIAAFAQARASLPPE